MNLLVYHSDLLHDEIAERALILSRVEAETLFTDLGHTLRDMHDCMDNYAEDMGEQPHV